MLYAAHIEAQSLNKTAVGFNTLLFVANWLLILSGVLLVVSILFSYPLSEFISMQWQIVCHISTILLATVLKVSYVLPCIALYSLGQEVR